MVEADGIQAQRSSVILACFHVGDGCYGVHVERVREIVRLVTITSLPNSPLLIEGVIDLRGSLVPVLDLSRVLGRGSGVIHDLSRVMIIDFDSLVFGLWVDAATDILTLDPSQLEVVPALATDAGYDAISSMVRRDHAPPVMVLSLENLIESICRSAPSPPGVGELE